MSIETKVTQSLLNHWDHKTKSKQYLTPVSCYIAWQSTVTYLLSYVGGEMVCVWRNPTLHCVYEEYHIRLMCFTQVNKSRKPFLKAACRSQVFFIKCSVFVFVISVFKPSEKNVALGFLRSQTCKVVHLALMFVWCRVALIAFGICGNNILLHMISIAASRWMTRYPFTLWQRDKVLVNQQVFFN